MASIKSIQINNIIYDIDAEALGGLPAKSYATIEQIIQNYYTKEETNTLITDAAGESPTPIAVVNNTASITEPGVYICTFGGNPSPKYGYKQGVSIISIQSLDYNYNGSTSSYSAPDSNGYSETRQGNVSYESKTKTIVFPTFPTYYTCYRIIKY